MNFKLYLCAFVLMFNPLSKRSGSLFSPGKSMQSICFFDNKQNVKQSMGQALTAANSALFTWPLSDTEPLGEDPSSDPSGTGDGGCGGET